MTSSDWNSTLLQLNNPHFLQTTEWAQLKIKVGWKPIYYQYPSGIKPPSAAALILKRQIQLGGFNAFWRILYAPKGPVLDWNDQDLRLQVLDQLEQITRKEKATFLKIDPDIILGEGLPGDDSSSSNPTSAHIISELRERSWTASTEQVQFRNTIFIDLAGTQDELLARMKQKTRYNIRLAARKGLSTRLGSKQELVELYRIYAETSIRDGFVIRERDYYLRTWEAFLNANMADILLSEFDGEIVAGLVLFRFGERAYYMHGMSRSTHREKMPSYLLQWEAMKRAKEMGCKIYDLWGAPDQFDESDPMWGVYRFKEGFGGTVIRTIGAWDYAVNPFLYRLYTFTLPKILEIMRRRSKRQTRNLVDI